MPYFKWQLANWCQHDPTLFYSTTIQAWHAPAEHRVFRVAMATRNDWLSRAGRKCGEDNRMCPGSAVEGRRIQGSYCTLWNGFRNARCLRFFGGLLRSASYDMLQALMIAWPPCDTCASACWSPTLPLPCRSHRQRVGRCARDVCEVDGKLVTWKWKRADDKCGP